MATHLAVSVSSVLATDIRFCVIDLKAFYRGKWKWFVVGEGFASAERRLLCTLWRIKKMLCEVMCAQADCRRRILCQVRVLTRVAAPDEILAKP